jgi:hypothetical protein
MKEKKKKLPDRVMIPDQGLKYYGKTKKDYVNWCWENKKKINDMASKREYFQIIMEEAEND